MQPFPRDQEVLIGSKTLSFPSNPPVSQRYEYYILINMTVCFQLGRSPSTVSREISRNGGYHQYRASTDEDAAWERARRPKACKLAGNYRLIRLIEKKLRHHWSPQQIAGWTKRHYPEDERYYVSHETIYKSLFIQARGVLKKELIQYLKTKRVMRRSKTSSLKGQGLGKIVDAVSISERPASVEDRAVPGHWEGDLIAGTNNSYIATLVERHTRYVMLARVTNKNSDTVIKALITKHRLKDLVQVLRRSVESATQSGRP